MDRAGYFEDGRWGFVSSLTIEATIETVWANVGDPDRLSQWWCPPPTVQVHFDQRVGGNYEERYRDSTSAYELSGKVLYLSLRRYGAGVRWRSSRRHRLWTWLRHQTSPGTGVEAFGIDLSPEMVAIARRDHPGLCFNVGTMTDLDLEDASLSGIVAFWSIIHIPDRDMPGVFDEFRRVLRPGGLLLVGFHVGDSIDRSSVGYTGEPINLRSYLRQPSTVAAWLHESEFAIESTLIMRPDDKQPGALLLARTPR